MKLYKLATGDFEGNSNSNYFLAAEKEPNSQDIKEILTHVEPRSGRQNPQKIAVTLPGGLISRDESCTRYAILSLSKDSVRETELDKLARQTEEKVLRF